MRSILAVLAFFACGIAAASTCYVTEFRERPPVTYQAAVEPTLADQTITFTNAASVQSAAFQSFTALVRIKCDAPAFVLFGTNPTATSSKMKLDSGQTEYFTVVLQSNLKVAVIGQ